LKANEFWPVREAVYSESHQVVDVFVKALGLKLVSLVEREISKFSTDRTFNRTDMYTVQLTTHSKWNIVARWWQKAKRKYRDWRTSRLLKEFNFQFKERGWQTLSSWEVNDLYHVIPHLENHDQLRSGLLQAIESLDVAAFCLILGHPSMTKVHNIGEILALAAFKNDFAIVEVLLMSLKVDLKTRPSVALPMAAIAAKASPAMADLIFSSLPDSKISKSGFEEYQNEIDLRKYATRVSCETDVLLKEAIERNDINAADSLIDIYLSKSHSPVKSNDQQKEGSRSDEDVQSQWTAKYGTTLLDFAVSYSDVPMVEMILSNGISMMSDDTMEKLLLVEKTDMLLCLLSHFQSAPGQLLATAMKTGKIDFIRKWLVKFEKTLGPQMFNWRDKNGLTISDVAARTSVHVLKMFVDTGFTTISDSTIQKLLSENEIDVLLFLVKGKLFSLHRTFRMALEARNIAVTSTLLKFHGNAISSGWSNETGVSALDEVSLMGEVPLVDLLLKNGFRQLSDRTMENLIKFGKTEMVFFLASRHIFEANRVLSWIIKTKDALRVKQWLADHQAIVPSLMSTDGSAMFLEEAINNDDIPMVDVLAQYGISKLRDQQPNDVHDDSYPALEKLMSDGKDVIIVLLLRHWILEPRRAINWALITRNVQFLQLVLNNFDFTSSPPKQQTHNAHSQKRTLPSLLKINFTIEDSMMVEMFLKIALKMKSIGDIKHCEKMMGSEFWQWRDSNGLTAGDLVARSDFAQPLGLIGTWDRRISISGSTVKMLLAPIEKADPSVEKSRFDFLFRLMCIQTLDPSDVFKIGIELGNWRFCVQWLHNHAEYQKLKPKYFKKVNWASWRDENSLTFMDLAIRNGHEDIALLLRSYDIMSISPETKDIARKLLPSWNI
jgi:ankyrin repeat protein